MDLESEEKLEAIRADVRLRLPVEAIIDELGAPGKPRDVVLGAAALLASEVAPALLDAVAHAAAGGELTERESSLAFYGLHLLGGARDTRAFPALMRILRLPSERLGRLLGDGLTETIKRVAIGVFDGRAEELYALIADDEVDEYARLEMFGVVAFLAFEGRIDLAEAKRFLISFDAERRAPAQNLAWSGWEEAIALLGFRDLAPRVEAAWRDGRTPEGYSAPKYFYADMERAETKWNDAERFKAMHHLGYIEDIVDELSWIALRDAGGEDRADTFDPEQRWIGAAPYVNPLRHVGRNDPCPCGSGKKAKRCCLAD